MERPLRREAHGGCGERSGETGRGQPRDRAPGLLTHDIEVMDEAGKVLAKRRLPEGAAGMAQLHGLIGQFVPEDDMDSADVVIGIETDRGPWVAALVAAGYTVYPVNPLQASRYRERHGVSGAKSDAGDAHMLADMVRTDSH